MELKLQFKNERDENEELLNNEHRLTLLVKEKSERIDALLNELEILQDKFRKKTSKYED